MKKLTVEQKLRKIIREEYTRIKLSNLLNNEWSKYRDGTEDEAPWRLHEPAGITMYIEKRLKGVNVTDLKLKKRTQPGGSHQYYHNIWSVTLSSGLTFDIDVYEGEPTFRNKIVYVLGITVE